MEVLQKMWFEINSDEGRVVIPVEVRWLANTNNMRESTQKREISPSSVILVVKGNKGVRRCVKETSNVVGLRYQVKEFTNIGPDNWCEHCCGWSQV